MHDVDVLRQGDTGQAKHRDRQRRSPRGPISCPRAGTWVFRLTSLGGSGETWSSHQRSNPSEARCSRDRTTGPQRMAQRCGGTGTEALGKALGIPPPGAGRRADETVPDDGRTSRGPARGAKAPATPARRQISPRAAMLTVSVRDTTMWSRSRTSISSRRSFVRPVRSMSPWLGSGTPDGWLW